MLPTIFILPIFLLYYILNMKFIIALSLLCIANSGYAQNRDSLIHEANQSFKREDYTVSVTLLEQAINLDKHHADNYIRYSDLGTSLRRIGQQDAALKAYNNAIALNTGNAYLYNNRASLRRELQDLKGALHDYTLALSVDPRNEESLLNRAYIKKLQGDLTGAKKDLADLLALNPQNYQARSNLAVIKLREKDYEGALRDFQDILKAHPGEAVVLNNIADAYLNLKQYPAGIEASNNAVTADPEYPLAYITRAELILAAGGDKQLALADLNKAISLGHDKVALHSLLEQCKK